MPRKMVDYRSSPNEARLADQQKSRRNPRVESNNNGAEVDAAVTLTVNLHQYHCKLVKWTPQ